MGGSSAEKEEEGAWRADGAVVTMSHGPDGEAPDIPALDEACVHAAAGHKHTVLTMADGSFRAFGDGSCSDTTRRAR